MKDYLKHISNSRQGFSDFKALLTSFKSTRELFKALIRVAPYPVTLWDADGTLLCANNEALELLGNMDHLENYCIWEDRVIKKHKNAIQSDNPVTWQIKVPSMPGFVNQLTGKCHEKLSGIEAIVCPVRNSKNAVELILIYFLDNSESIALKRENQQLNDEYLKLKTTIETVHALLKENENHAKDHILSEIKNNLAFLMDKYMGIEALTGPDIKKIEKIINHTCAKYQLKKTGTSFNFTPSEKKIYEMLKAGLSGKEIAQSLHVSYSTVHTHVNHIRKKINITGKKINLQTFIMNNHE
ncbi:MAG: helix-turn-helix transcriptional regulator [Bacteroidales bacterium]|nr:helix-turn-helix transcriptional regulator [Bacteroidales bacterium]